MSSPAPEVSVVVATHNRAARLERLLAAMRAQRYEGAWELIVVDDASTDRTHEVLAAAQECRVITRKQAGGPAAARNTGWRDARGALVAFTDDDCEPRPDWLAVLLSVSTENPGSIVQGVTVPHPEEARKSTPFSRTLRDEALGPWFPMSNMAYPRALLERLGGFDEGMLRGEDTDLAWRALESGARAVHAPGSVVWHGVVELGPAGRLRVAWAWHVAVRNMRTHPQLRDNLLWGIFWKRTHVDLLLALLGAALLRRSPLALFLCGPYLRSVRARVIAERAEPFHAPYYVIHDLAEILAMARGSVEYRTLVL